MKSIYEYIGLAAVTFLNLFVFAKPILPLLKSLKAKKDNADGEIPNTITDQDNLVKQACDQTYQNDSHDEKLELISDESRKAKIPCDDFVDSNWLDEINRYILNLPDIEVTENHEKFKLTQRRGQWISIIDQLGHFSSIYTKMTTIY